MNSNILFEEKQYFRQIWLWILLIGVFIFLNYELYLDKKTNSIFMVFLLNLPLAIPILFIFISNLKTKIDEKAIHFQFYPFHIGFIDFKLKKMEKSISFDDIEKMEIVTYNPIFDYGGWGIRYGGMNTIAYNTMGNKGLLIYKKNKQKVLIGTQKPEILTKIINQINLT
jgi:hypothetical protein